MTVNSIYSSLSEALNNIEKQENLTIQNKEKMLLYLYNATTYIWGPTKILYNPNEEFFVNLNNYYDAFTQRIKKLHSAIIDNELPIYYDETVLDQLLFMLVTAWDSLSLQLENNVPIVKVALFVNTSYEHTIFLRDDLQYHLKNRLIIDIPNSKTITDFTGFCQDYDMIITNLSTLEICDPPIVSIQTNPTARDFERILCLYNHIVHSKVENDQDVLEKTNSIYRY
ncbi:hypothetical protein ACV6EA_12345 [Enterococcus hirae]